VLVQFIARFSIKCNIKPKAAAKPESSASFQTGVRELSPMARH
jgi:hypothetical protein